MRIMNITEDMYDELVTTLADFENATDNADDEDYMSDGEWLDVFYALCKGLKHNITIISWIKEN